MITLAATRRVTGLAHLRGDVLGTLVRVVAVVGLVLGLRPVASPP